MPAFEIRTYILPDDTRVEVVSTRQQFDRIDRALSCIDLVAWLRQEFRVEPTYPEACMRFDLRVFAGAAA